MKLHNDWWDKNSVSLRRHGCVQLPISCVQQMWWYKQAYPTPAFFGVWGQLQQNLVCTQATWTSIHKTLNILVYVKFYTHTTSNCTLVNLYTLQNNTQLSRYSSVAGGQESYLWIFMHSHKTLFNITFLANSYIGISQKNTQILLTIMKTYSFSHFSLPLYRNALLFITTALRSQFLSLSQNYLNKKQK